MLEAHVYAHHYYYHYGCKRVYICSAFEEDSPQRNHELLEQFIDLLTRHCAAIVVNRRHNTDGPYAQPQCKYLMRVMRLTFFLAS